MAEAIDSEKNKGKNEERRESKQLNNGGKIKESFKEKRQNKTIMENRKK